MIIFDLDDTLANCEHRKHFTDWHKTDYSIPYDQWKPDWKSFYEACDRDEPILPTIHLLLSIAESNEYGTDTPYVDWEGIEIWSGRCESVRKKTEKWLKKNLSLNHSHYGFPKLKMRQIGDYTPDDQLKEQWLHALIRNDPNTYDIAGYAPETRTYPIDFVFDSNPKSIEMWRKHGIFVFNCCQHDEEF